MIVIMYVLAGIQLVMGVMILTTAQSAVHETVAAIAIAGGSISLGITFLMQMQEKQADERAEMRKLLERVAERIDASDKKS